MNNIIKHYYSKDAETAAADEVQVDLHGLENLMHAKRRFEKVLWTIIIVVAVAVSIWWSAVSIERFLDNPTAVEMKVETTPKMEVPDILLCSTAILNYTKLRHMGFTEAVYYSLVHHFTVILNSKTMSRTKLDNRMKEFQHLDEEAEKEITRAMSRRNMSIIQFIADAGIDCNQFLLICTIGSTPFNCCDKAEPFINEFYGSCYLLKDLKTIDLQKGTGATEGLAIVFDQGLESAREPSNSTLAQKNAGIVEQGVLFEVDHDFMFSSGVFSLAMGGRSTYALLRSQHYLRSEKSKTGCVPSQVPGESMTSRLCQAGCWGDAWLAICNCAPIGYVMSANATDNDSPRGLTKPPPDRVCTPYERSRCMQRGGGPRVDQLFYGENDRRCGTAPCDEWMYSIGTSYLDLNQQRLARNADARMDARLGTLYMYYADLSYITYKEFQTMTFDSIVSAIGGTVGLFMGASIITGVQLIVSLLGKCFMYIHHARVQQRNSKQESNSQMKP